MLLGLMLLVGVTGYGFLRPAAAASGPVQAMPVQTTSSSTIMAAAVTADVNTFVIQPDTSQARFVIDEVLRGVSNTVVGSTSQVAGQIAADPTQPSGAQVGTIQID